MTTTPPSQAKKKKEKEFIGVVCPNCKTEHGVIPVPTCRVESIQCKCGYMYHGKYGMWSSPMERMNDVIFPETPSTPPKPTIREELKQKITAIIMTNDVDEAIDKLAALLSPQTGEGECLTADCRCHSVHHNVDCCRVCSTPQSASEEMEKEFDEEFVGTNIYGVDYLVSDTTPDEIKAFLRKQLDLQEKWFREMIGEDEKLTKEEKLSREGDDRDVDYAVVRKDQRNRFRAELRSKLNSKK